MANNPTNEVASSTKLAIYKQQVVSTILADKKITDALDPNVETGELLYNNIFPFGKIPGTIDEAKSYITIEVSIPKVSTVNRFFKEVLLTLTVIVHDDLMKTDYGMTRLDYLGIALEELFNQKALQGLGIGKLELVSNIEGAWTDKHSYREIRFRFSDSNGNRCVVNT